MTIFWSREKDFKQLVDLGLFEENIAGSKSHLAFAEQGKIGFEEGVDGFVRGGESQDSTKVSSCRIRYYDRCVYDG